MSFEFNIEDYIATLSEGKWSKELNIVKWESSTPKYDIREWSPDHEKMGKGTVLTIEELIRLRDTLIKMDLGEL